MERLSMAALVLVEDDFLPPALVFDAMGQKSV